jgi:hypothetical protein
MSGLIVRYIEITIWRTYSIGIFSRKTIVAEIDDGIVPVRVHSFFELLHTFISISYANNGLSFPKFGHFYGE